MLSARTWSERRSTQAETAAVGIAAVWLARPFLTAGRYVSAFDAVNYSIPNHIVTMDAWRAGRLPLWNDLIFGGVPHLGNSQAGVLYPVRLLTWGIEPTRAINLLVAFHVFLLAFGMLWLGRRLGCRPPAGFIAALIGVANGAALTRSLQFEQFCVIAWAPLVLLGLHSCLTSTRPLRAIGLTSLVASMAVLAGHPQMTYMLGALAALWIGILSEQLHVWRRWWAVLSCGLLTLALCSVQLAATISATRLSALQNGRDIASLSSRELSVLPGRIAMVLLGTVLDIDPAKNAGAFEAVGYVGVAAVALAVCGVVASWKSSTDRVLVVGLSAATTLFVVLSFGPRTVVFDAVYRWLPGFDLSRASARWLTPAALCLALLAGLGAQALLSPTLRAWTDHIQLAIGLGCAAMSVGALFLSGTLETPGRKGVLGWTVAAVLTIAAVVLASRGSGHLASALIVTILIVELGAAATHSFPRTVTDSQPVTAGITPVTEYLRTRAGWAISLSDDVAGPLAVSGLRPNANVIAGVRSIDGYDGGVQATKSWVAFVSAVAPNPAFDVPLRNQIRLPLSPQVAGKLGIRFVHLSNDRVVDEHLIGWKSPVFSDDRFSVYENSEWIGDALIGSTDLDLVRHSPERMTVDVSGASGLLMVDGQAQSGWKVSVDGTETVLDPADGFRLAVQVPPGSRNVEFFYRPRWLQPGLLVATAGLLVLSGLFGADRRQRRRPRESATRDPR